MYSRAGQRDLLALADSREAKSYFLLAIPYRRLEKDAEPGLGNSRSQGITERVRVRHPLGNVMREFPRSSRSGGISDPAIAD